jgi:hemerythrin
MDYITWEVDFNTGHKDIDAQHQKLIGYINDLHASLKMNKNAEELNEILKGLMQYTIYHFGLEEELMTKSNYPGYENHKREHQIFIERLEKLSYDLNSRERKIIYRLLSFLKVWFSGHIMMIDRKMVDFVMSNLQE